MIENLDGEIWRDVVGYEGLYMVSNMGRVKSLKFNKEIIRKLIKDKDGYHHLNLSLNNKIKYYLVHRLVLIAFEGEKEGYEVDHKNNNKEDNRLENLHWVSSCDNNKYKFSRDGIIPNNKKYSDELKEEILDRYKDYDGSKKSFQEKFYPDIPYGSLIEIINMRFTSIKKSYNCKAVIQYSKDGEYVQEFRSIREASKKLNINYGSISWVCKGKYNIAGNFIFKYKENT